MIGMNVLRRVAVYLTLISFYCFVYIVALLGRVIPRGSWKPNGRILVTARFDNPNWYLSHVTPLSRSGVKEVIVVVDEPQQPLDKVTFVCPPRWVARLVGRTPSKGIWLIIAGFRYRPDLYMGYHLVPGACAALVSGKLFRRPTGYQVTGGPIEIIGGGYAAIDSPESALMRPSKLIEALALKVVRQFDLVVVRGSEGKAFIEKQNVRGSVAIITGSTNASIESTHGNRDIDIIFVGRLSPIKQVNQFVEIVDQVVCEMPGIRAAVVGDGPLLEELQDYSKSLGLTNNIEFMGQRKDVESILARSKTFVLTSKSEGLSIAMAEAMTAGVVPVVTNVGELGDLVVNGVNGYLIEPGNISEYARKVLLLLRNRDLWKEHSLKAISDSKAHCDVSIVSEKWWSNIQHVVSKAGGLYVKEALS